MNVTADDGNGGVVTDTFIFSVSNSAPVTTGVPTPPAYSDANGNNQYDPGEDDGTIISGTISGGRTGGQTVVTRNFDVPAGSDPNTRIGVNFTTLDNSATIQVNGQSVVSPSKIEFEAANFEGTATLSADADGLITLQDGATVAFDDLERIQW